MEKHFVVFYFPGTFFSETVNREIALWNVAFAISMAREFNGRKPYAFSFITRSRQDNELDSKVTDTSSMYYLGGTVRSLKQVESRNDPQDSILISNMKNNNYERVITTIAGSTVPFYDDTDVLLDF